MTIPPWFALALLAAVAWAALDALCKRALREHSARAVLGARWWYALPFLALPLFAAPPPRLDATFWLVLLVSCPLEVWAMFLYLRALDVAPLSLTAPLMAWTPVFSSLFSTIVLREVPSVAGAAGILLVVAGSWMLYAEGDAGTVAPLRRLSREPGARLVLAVALIFSVTSALGKLGMLHSSVTFFGAAYVAGLAVCLAAVSIARGAGREAARELRPNRWFVAIGIGTAAMTLLHFAAIGMTKVAYLVAVKRSSLLFSVLLGRACFGEGGLARRLPGAATMFAGVVLLALGT